MSEKIPSQSTMTDLLGQPLFEVWQKLCSVIDKKYEMERFKKVYQQGAIDVVEIWIDTETGVNYVFHRNGNAAGFTPLLDKEGKPVVTPQQ